MVNDKVQFDFGADFADSNYKSCFARSIAVNSSISQKQAAKSLQPASSVANGGQSHSTTPTIGPFGSVTLMMNGNGTHQNGGEVTGNCVSFGKGAAEHIMQQDPVLVTMQNSPMMVGDTIVKLRKPLGISSEDTRRYSCNSGSAGSRRTSICSSRITEVPDVETVLLQSQVDTLQWQLKQTLESRKMYRNVMKQVVTFLDRAHKNLQLLGKKMNTSMPSTVFRSKSEHHVNGYHSREGSISSTTLPTDCADYESISEYSWRQSMKPDPPSSDEVPPEKLSQEAFRLLRTVQSLLNTREPDLSSTIEPPPNPASTASPTPSDIDFLVQLAKEFPSQDSPVHSQHSSYRTPNRTTSFSLSPKLLTPEKDNPNNLHRLATAFNRKLSLQLTDSNGYNPSNKHLNLIHHNSPRTSVADSDCGLLSSTVLDEFKDPKAKFKFEPEKSNSPPVSTVSSVEDESGFSSMNSFQEVGLPAPDDPKMALLKSMLHSDEDDQRKTIMENKKVEEAMEEFSLWQRPQAGGVNGVHKRWSSTPVDAISTGNDKQGLKVLWV